MGGGCAMKYYLRKKILVMGDMNMLILYVS